MESFLAQKRVAPLSSHAEALNPTTRQSEVLPATFPFTKAARPARIVVAAGQAEARTALAACLRLSGHEVLEAATGAECLAQASAAGSADLILIDANLPDVSGFELCRHLKQKPETTRIPLVLLRAPFVADPGECAAAFPEAEALLARPFGPQELISHISQLLRLRQAEELFQHSMEFSPQIPWTSTSEGTIEHFSERYVKLTGLSRAALYGDGWTQVPHPEDVPRMQAAWLRSVETGEPYQIEHRIKTADGTYRWMRSQAVAHRDPEGRIVRWYGFTEDIHERVETELALRRSEERLSLAQRAGGVGVFDWYVLTGEVLWSAELERVYGMQAPPDSPGRHRAWADHVHPADRESVFRLSAEWLASGEPELHNEYRFIRPDGEERWIAGHSLVFRDAEGRPLRVVGTNTDITQRKRAEEALKDSEARYRRLVETATEGICVVSSDHRLLELNQRLARMLGYTKEELVGRDARELILPAEHADFEQRARNRKPGEEDRYERNLVRKDGQILCVLVSAAPLLDQAGAVIGSVGMLTDITARKLAERALQEKEELLASIYAGVEAAITVSEVLDDGRAFRVLSVNRACVDWSGIPEERWIGRRPEDLVPPEQAAAVCGRYRTAYELGASICYEDCLSFPKGDKWSLTTVSPLRDAQGRVTRLVASCLDISERKRVEAALREAIERHERQVRLFEGVASTTPDFVYLFDLEGQFLYANRRLLEVWGMQLADIVGKTCRQLGYEQWHHEMHMQEIAQVISTKRPIKGEVPFKAPRTGIYGVYEYIFTPVLGPDGEVEVIAGTTRDVTDRKQAEQVLARDRQKLEELVEERTARLQELVGELEHFSYTITHDMRAPLRAMRGLAEILNEENEQWSPVERKKFIQHIITAAERMDGLITDALHYSRMVKQELPLVPVDVGRLLRGMLETYPEFQGSQADIAVDPELPWVVGNEAALTQCFSNLLGNAVKFAPPGQKARVRVWGERRAEWVRLWVEDNGVGISPGMLSRVFDMFSRGSHPQAGTGIGLALVRKVVDRMHGRVGVESEAGQGSRFWVELKPAEPRNRAA